MSNSFSTARDCFIKGLIIFSAIILTNLISLLLLLVTVIEFSFLLFGPYSLMIPKPRFSVPFLVISVTSRSTSSSIPFSLESLIMNVFFFIYPLPIITINYRLGDLFVSFFLDFSYYVQTVYKLQSVVSGFLQIFF